MGTPQRRSLCFHFNDLPTNIMSDVFMFADDTKMYRTIRGPNDQRILQADLDNLSTWSTKRLLRFHPDKCKIMHIGAETDIGGVYTLKVDNMDHELGYVTEEQDIGVIVDAKLEFYKHIYTKINKASSIMAVIRKSFTTLNKTNFPPLFKALVRSHLEYASSVWSPYKQKHRGNLKGAKTRNQTTSGYETFYTRRLEILKLPTLVYRRTKGDMIKT